MTLKEILLDQMTACFDETNWFVPLNIALEGLTAENASWHDGSTNHSICQIANHLIFWNERYLKRFKEIPISNVEGDNNSTFTDESAKASGVDWNSTLAQLIAVMSELRNAIADADESKLESSPYSDRFESWYSIISNINIHNAYHIGQIICIRKLQGSWNSEQGVK